VTAQAWLRGGITTLLLRNMKTAISIPDEIFEQAERLAKTRGWSRSELYANAVSAFVNSERFSGVREKLDAVYADGMATPATANSHWLRLDGVGACSIDFHNARMLNHAAKPVEREIASQSAISTRIASSF
jgi:predicted transcriptional regulator